MQEPPLCSFVLPVYNTGEELLHDCLQSLIAQTETRWEAICVNDGSTNNSLDILREYEARDARFRVVDQANAGVSAARNAGIAEVRAPSLIFVDADDWLAPTCLQKALEAQAAHPDCLIMYGMYERFMDAPEKNREMPAYLNYKRGQDSLFLNFHTAHGVMSIDPHPWNKLFKTEIIRKHQIEYQLGVPINEDMRFVLDYVSYVKRAYTVDLPLYFYRQHTASLCGAWGRFDRPVQDYLWQIELYPPLMERVLRFPFWQRRQWQIGIYQRISSQVRGMKAWMYECGNPRPEVLEAIDESMACFKARFVPKSIRAELVVRAKYPRLMRVVDAVAGVVF